MQGKRVVVTGLGMVSPVGLDVDTSWKNICNGVSGAAMIESFDAQAFTTRFSCSVKNFSVDGFIAPKDAKRMDPFVQFGMVAGVQAFRDSGIEITDANNRRLWNRWYWVNRTQYSVNRRDGAQENFSIFCAWRYYQYDQRQSVCHV